MFILDHFEGVADFEASKSIDHFRGMVLDISAQLWARLVVCFQETWPWPLFRIIDPKVDKATALQIAKDFFNADSCELDADFSEWVRRSISAPDCGWIIICQ